MPPSQGYGRNPFITIGAGGIPVTTPIVQGGKFAPAIYNMAQEYAKSAQQNVSSYLGARGLTSSSGYPQLLEQAFRGGFEQSVNTFQNQQSLYNSWARDIINLKANESLEPKRNRGQAAIAGALSGAQVGGSAAGGKGALIGGGIGLAAGLFGLI